MLRYGACYGRPYFPAALRSGTTFANIRYLGQRAHVAVSVQLPDQPAAIVMAKLRSDHSLRQAKPHKHVMRREVPQLIRGDATGAEHAGGCRPQ